MLPVFILLVLGVVDGGRAILAYNTAASAARNGARVAVVNQASSGTVAASACDTTSGQAWAMGCAVYSAKGTIALSTSDVSVAYRDPTDTTTCLAATGYVVTNGCLAEVTVSARFTAITPVIGQLIGPMTITSTAKVPVERTCSSGC